MAGRAQNELLKPDFWTFVSGSESVRERGAAYIRIERDCTVDG